MARKILFVGDVHATPEDLDDCRRLMDFVRSVARSEAVDEVCLLGDSYHTHNIIRAEVMAFWRQAFRQMPVSTRVLVGNHDYAGEGSQIHAMMAHEEQVQVVAFPDVEHGILFLPYYSDRTAFVDACRSGYALGGKTLVCHQTFAGSKYENGMYAPDGVDPELVPQSLIISGHIHAPQSFGKVIYLGAPRWRTLSDANTDRAIWLYEFDDAGHVLSTKSFDTGTTCRQIRYVLDTPDEPFAGVLDPRHDWRVDVRGPADYVEARKVFFSGSGARVRTFKTTLAAPRVRESEGIGPAFHSYRTRFVPKFGTPEVRLAELAQERLGL